VRRHSVREENACKRGSVECVHWSGQGQAPTPAPLTAIHKTTGTIRLSISRLTGRFENAFMAPKNWKYELVSILTAWQLILLGCSESLFTSLPVLSIPFTNLTT
jgi:hypothetical protein